MKNEKVLLALALSIAVSFQYDPAQAYVYNNIWSEGTWLEDPNNINPPPSTVEGYIRLLQADGHAAGVLGPTGPRDSSHTGTLGDKGLVEFLGRSYELSTLTVANVAVELKGYDGDPGYWTPDGSLTLSNTTLARPSLVVGDSTGDGFAWLDLNWGMHLQSFGFANIGAPVIPGAMAEGVMTISSESTWFHNGLITIGQGSGAGLLNIKGEVSWGLSDRSDPDSYLNIFVGRNAVPLTHSPTFRNDQLQVEGDLYVDELVVEGRGWSTGGLHADLVQIQNGGYFGVGGEVARLEIGNQGSGEAYLGGTAGVVTVGDASGTRGKLRVRIAEIGDPTSNYAYDRFFDVANNGGTGEVVVDGTETANASLLVHGLTQLAAGYSGGTASLSVIGGGQFTGTSEIRAATYHNYDGPQSTATILVEGAGSKLTATDLWLGANDSTLSYGNWGPGAAGSGHLTVRDGGLLDIAGKTETYTLADGYGGQHTNTIYTPGTLVAGPDTIIDGNGTIRVGNPNPNSDGNGVMRALGTLSPGNSPGWLTIDGDLSLAGPEWGGNGGSLRIELGGTTPGLEYDVLEVLGDLDLTGAVLELYVLNGFTFKSTSQFSFLQVHGGIFGNFAALEDHTGFGLTLANLNFGENGIVTLNGADSQAAPVPLPGTLILLGSGLAGLVGAHRKKKASLFAN